MSKVKIEGHGTGTGTFTVTTPSSNTDRTITLPDATGTLATTDDNGSQLDHSGTKKLEATSTGATLTGDLAINDAHPEITFTDSDDTSHSVVYHSAGAFLIDVDKGEDVANSYFRLSIDDTPRLRVTADGLLFNSDTAAANALDDYEEGTHTATLTMGSGTAALHSYGNQLSYTKIGRVVHVCGQVRIGSVSSPDGGLQMSMPFTVASGNTGLSVGNYRAYQVDTPNDGVQAVIHSEPGQALATLQWVRDGSTPTAERATQNGYLMIGLTYMT